MNSPVKAFVFDLDGVIVDTAVYHFASWRAIARKLGIHLPDAMNERLKGLGRMESLDVVLELHDGTLPIEEKRRLAAEKNNIYLENIRHVQAGDTLPGVSAFLTETKAAGIRMAIGSGSKNARPILDRLEIAETFDAVCDGTDISRSKPDPEIFLCAIEKLGVFPNETVVFEDAASGVEAARSAGAHTIGIGDEAHLGAADAVFASFSEFSVSDILNRFA